MSTLALSAAISYQVWRSNRQGDLIEDISDQVVRQKVSFNEDAHVSKWQYTGESKNSLLFGRLADYVIPMAQFDYDDGSSTGMRRLGHYIVKKIGKSHPEHGTEITFVCEDLVAAISRIQVMSATTIAAGINVQTWLVGVLTTTLGFVASQVAIPEIAKSPSLPVTYPEGTKWITIINNTLQAVGMRSLYMTVRGLLTTTPTSELAAISPSMTYTDAEIVGEPTEDPDDSRIKNVQTVKRSVPGEPEIVATWRNEDASSPLYWLNPEIGQLAGEVIDAPQVADYDTAMDLARAEGRYGSSFYNRGAADVVPNLEFDAFQVVAFDIRDIASTVQMSGAWFQRTIDFAFGPPVTELKAIKISINRTEPFRTIRGGS